MHNETRLLFRSLCADMAKLNGVDNVAESYSVSPTVQQTLEQKVQEQADFLTKISSYGVEQIKGEKVGMFGTGTVAGRTDTTVADRQTQDIHDTSSIDYECFQTNYDTHIRYPQLDVWAKFKNFKTMIRTIVFQQMARDRLMIGWNGTHSAATTNRAANALLQDVNMGWLEYLRQFAPLQVDSDGVNIGDQAGKDFNTLDATVMEAVSSLIKPWHQEGSGLVCVLGRDLLDEKYITLVDANERPTEQIAMKTLMANKLVGGLPAITVPFFPARSILVTNPKNLSHYWQRGTHRQKVEDNSKRDRIEFYESNNEDFVVEETDAAALIENIKKPDGAGGWA